MSSPAEHVAPADAATMLPTDLPTDLPWRDIDAIDRSWASIEYTRSVTGIDLPGSDRIRDALLSLARQAPEVGRWTTPDQLRWRPVAEGEWDRWLDQAFDASPEADADVARVAALNSRPLESTPFRLLAGPDWLSTTMCHGVGDGWTVNRFVGELLARAAREDNGPSPLPWTVLTQRQRDRVIRRDVRGSLGTVLWALRHRGELAGGVYETAGADTAPGRDVTFELASDPGLLGELRRLRDEHFAGVSAAVLTTVALRAVVRDALTTPQPGFECLFNTRDEKAGTATAWGNYSAGVYLRPPDVYDPVAVGAEMQRVRGRGLPGLGHASLRVRGGRAGGAEVTMPRREGAPRLTMSYLQSHHMDPWVPGLRPGRTRQSTVTRPNGADSVTMQVIECAGRLNVAVSHFPHVWPGEPLRAAVEAYLADPRAVLGELRRSSRR